MARKKYHHATVSEYGVCRICSKPILKLWEDAAETTGQSETVQESREGNAHYRCVGGRGLAQLNRDFRRILKS